MKKIILTAFFSSVIGITAIADDAPKLEERTINEASNLRDLALKNNSSFDILSDLTTDVGPRLAGSQAEHRAFAWAVERMKNLGFDKVWTESFPMQVWSRGHESLTVLGNATQKMEITALGRSVATKAGGVEGDIIHFDTFEDMKNAPAEQVKGKIVFISNRMERKKDGSGYGPAVIARGAGASVAGEKGAIALLIRSIGTDSHRLPHTGTLRYDENKPKIPAAALSNPDADQMLRLLSRGNVKIHLELETKFVEGESKNVIGEITGRELKDEYVVLSSHIDSWDLGTGAVDDGAGVALNIATANLIKTKASQRPRRTIRVILFGAEEAGLFGARAYAARHKAEMDKFIVGAESDFGAGPIWALASKVGDDAIPVVDKMAQLMGPLGVIRSNSTAHGGPDIGQLGALGMPMIDLKQDGTDYFDLHHTGDDTLDKVDPAAMSQNLAAWAAFTYIAADWPGSFR